MYVFQERVPFEVCEIVTWAQFTLALNMRWTLANVQHLNDSHLDYLASKLYGGKLHGQLFHFVAPKRSEKGVLKKSVVCNI